MPSNREEQARLLSLAVHEFRTPITVAAGYIRMLLKHYGEGLGEQPRKLLEEAEKSCARLSGLVSDLSDMAQLDDGRAPLARQEIPVFRLLAEVAGGVHEGEERGVALRLVGAATDGVVEGDPARLRKALQAVLVATLREYVQPGMVPVWAEVVRDAPCDSRPAGSPWALIVVGDEAAASSGYRFDPGEWGEFQEFRGGLGFSLPMARRVIEGAGGCVWSRPGSTRRAAIALALPLKEKLG